MPERLEQLLKLFESDPADAFVAYGIAMEYSKLADHDQAIHWLDRTIGIDPNYLYAYYQKARSLSQIGQITEARSVVNTGIDAARSVADAHAQEELTSLLDELGQ